MGLFDVFSFIPFKPNDFVIKFLEDIGIRALCNQRLALCFYFEYVWCSFVKGSVFLAAFPKKNHALMCSQNPSIIPLSGVVILLSVGSTISSRLLAVMLKNSSINPHSALRGLWCLVQWFIEYIFFINNLNVPTFHVIFPNTFNFLHKWFYTENAKNVEEIWVLLKKKHWVRYRASQAFCLVLIPKLPYISSQIAHIAENIFTLIH